LANNNLQVNTFPLDAQIESLTELCDGLVFCRMLGMLNNYSTPISIVILYTNIHCVIEDLDPNSTPSELEKNAGGSSKWLRKKMCLEAVYKSLLRFIRDHRGDMDYLTTGSIDFDKMAEDDDVQNTMKVRRRNSDATRFDTALTNTCDQLLVIFLMATLNTSDDVKREGYVVKIQSLDQISQVQIMTLVSEVSTMLPSFWDRNYANMVNR